MNSARQLRWYFIGFAGSSLLVEASKLVCDFGSWQHDITVHEEISLHWDNVVSEQLHIGHSSAIYYSAKEMPRRGRSCQSWLLRNKDRRNENTLILFFLLCIVESPFFAKNIIKDPYTLYFYEHLVMLLRNN